MSNILKPTTEAQVLETVQWAVSGDLQPLEIIGHGTKRGMGARVKTDTVLDLSELLGILLYEPDELVMSAKAGTPLDDIEAALDEKNQMLAFEPRRLEKLYGEHGGTIGGVFALGGAGPRRPLVGSARDHLLGFHAISGRGELFKSGGRVVKNVTGFDLSKLMVGSMGTLAVMTDVSFKVLPKPEKSRTVLLMRATDPNQVMREAQNSSFEVSGVAYLPENIAGRSAVSYIHQAKSSIVAVRIEGPAPSVEVRCQALRSLLSAYGEVEQLHSHNTQILWQEIRDVAYFAPDKQIWRLSVAPNVGFEMAEKLGGDFFCDWAGGLIWLGLDATPDASVDQVRGSIAQLDSGHATLIRADENVRASVSVFQPEQSGLAQLSKRVQAGFDPREILNPGRLIV